MSNCLTSFFFALAILGFRGGVPLAEDKIKKIILGGEPTRGNRADPEAEFVPQATVDTGEIFGLRYDAVFKDVMSNVEAVEPFVQDVVGDSNAKVIGIEVEKSLGSANSNECVLDILVQVSDGALVNVELQLLPKDNLIRRARYYQAAIDVFAGQKSPTKAQKKYALDDVFVVFLCSEASMPVRGATLIVNDSAFYVDGKRNTELSDGRRMLFINFERYSTKLSNAGLLCSALCGEYKQSSYSRALRQLVQLANGKKEVRSVAMKNKDVWELEDAAREYGRADAIATVIRNLKAAGVAVDAAIAIAGVDRAYFDNLCKQYPDLAK